MKILNQTVKLLFVFLMVFVFFELFIWLAAILINFFFDHFMDIDTCLDRGGAWDYQKEQCDQ